MTRERDVERHLVVEVRKLGGVAYKWVSPGQSGVPDRIVILPGGDVRFIELKADAGRLSPLQTHQHKLLRAAGARVEVLYGRADVDAWLAEVRA